MKNEMSKTHSNNNVNLDDVNNDDEADSNDGSSGIDPETYIPPNHSASTSPHNNNSNSSALNQSGPVGGGGGGGVEEKEKRTRSRKWSDEEVDLFLKILGDPRYMFAASLENLVPKKRSNYEIFTNIRNVFRRELKELHRNRLPGFEYSMSLDLSIEKLRKKYSNLKVEWRRMSTDRVLKGQQQQMVEHFTEPRWYRSVQKLMTDIKVASQKVNNITNPQESSSLPPPTTSTTLMSANSSPFDDEVDGPSAPISHSTTPSHLHDSDTPTMAHHERPNPKHLVKDEMLMMVDEQPTFVVISNRQPSTNHYDNNNSKPLYSNGGASQQAYSPRVREYPPRQTSYGESSSSAGTFNGIEAELATTDENHHHITRHSPLSSNNNNNINNNKRTSAYSGASISPPQRPGTLSYSSKSGIEYRYPYSKRQRMAYSNTSAPNTPSHTNTVGVSSSSSNSRNINEMANGLRQLAELQMKRQRMIIEADFKTYELFLRHKEQETEKNRAHELHLAEIYAQALTRVGATSPTPSSALKKQEHRYEHYGGEASQAASYKTMSEVEREMTSPSFSPAHSYNGSYRSGGDQS